MELSLTGEQAEFRDEIAAFVDTEIVPQAASIDRADVFPEGLVATLAEQGYLGMPFALEYGGMGLDYHAYAEGIAEISRGSGGLGTVVAAHTSLAGTMINRFGTDTQRKTYLTPLAEGNDIGAFALSEAGAGSDVPAMETTAVLDNDSYRITGDKLWTSNGSVADTIVTFAKTDPNAGRNGISAFIVRPTEDSGVSVIRTEQKIGDHGCPAAALSFDAVKVPVARRLGAEGDGFVQALKTLNGGRITIAARGVGLARAAQDVLLENVPAESSQRYRHTIAENATKITAAESLLHRAAADRMADRPYIESAAVAKLYSSEISREVSGAAIDLLGLPAAVEDARLQRIYRDAKLNEIYEGTSEILKNTIAQRVIERSA